MSNIVVGVIILFSIIAAIDKMIGNKFGFVEDFEEGFKSMGSLALTILGIYTLSPLIGKALLPILIPIFKITGIDPSIFMGIFLAPDMGGYNSSIVIAASENIGVFSGLIIGSMLGTTIIFTLPIAFEILKEKDREIFSKGILYGIMTIPIGSMISGIIMKIDINILLLNHIPIMLFSIIIAFSLFLVPEKLFKCFKIFNKFILLISTFGLIVGILEFILNISILKGIIPFEEGLVVVGKIAIILSGAYPLVNFISKKLKYPLSMLGRRLNINQDSVLGIIASMVNAIPMLKIYKNMDYRGKILNAAFGVSGSFVFGGQMAFVLGVSPDAIVPFIIGKLIAGLSGIILVIISTREYKFNVRKFRAKKV